MENKNKTAEQVRIVYTLDHPLELVFRAWTDPDYLFNWFAPTGCTLFFKHLDIRVGGSFHSCISNPDFGDCWCIGTYLEIRPLEKIVYTMVNADEAGNPIDPASIGMHPDWPGETLVTIHFSEQNGSTLIQLEQTVAAALAKQTGAYPSWILMLERLDQMLDKAN